MSAKHTPGPWGVERTQASDWVGPMRRNGGGKIAAIVCKINRDGYRDYIVEEKEANARLIAAAPDLLEELKNMAIQYGCECGHPHCRRCEDTRSAQAAIAKAEGRT